MKLVLASAIAAALMPRSFHDEVQTEAGQPGGGAAAPAKPKKEREVETVEMQDGRKVEFVGKRKMLKETTIDGTQVSVRLDFRNGNSTTFVIPDQLLLKSAGHGMEQKLGDETAGTEDVDDMQMEVEALIERLKAGEWTTKREGTGFGGASVLVKALMEATGKDQLTVKDFLKAKVEAGTTYQKLNDAFAEDETVGPIIKRLKKEKAGDSKVDTKALLGSLA